MCGDGRPGNLQIGDTPEITTFDEGTETPGFQASYYINDNYAKNNLIPALLNNTNSPFIALDKKYKFSQESGDLNIQLIIRVNANPSDEDDLSKQNVYVKKFSIKNWNGEIYLNLNIKNIDRKYSNVQIGTINTTVNVKEYKPLIERLSDRLTKTDIKQEGLAFSIGNAISKLFNKSEKQDSKWAEVKPKISGIPGAQIKCVVNFDRNLKKNITLNSDYLLDFGINRSRRYRYSRWYNPINNNLTNTSKAPQQQNKFKYTDTYIDINAIKKLIPIKDFENAMLIFKKDPLYEISLDITDDDSWTQAKKNGNLYEPIEKEVDNKTEEVCLYIYSNLDISNHDIQKLYKIFLNINDWKNSNYKNEKLFNNNSIKPMINISVYSEDGNEILSRWFTQDNFKKAEPLTYEYVSKKLLRMNTPAF